MSAETEVKSLKQLLAAEGGGVLAPGVYDAFGALLATQAGFEALYLSGASVAYTRLGRPDVGLVSAAEVADTVALIRDRVATPLIVDGDTGFGNAMNVKRTVRVFERAGASAIQLEDQGFPKRCGHLKGKTLIAAEEMVGKIRAATDARASEETLIIARTDAIAVDGFEAALERGEMYVAAGADVLFIEAPASLEQMDVIARRFSGRIPLLANMVEGGQTPINSADDLHARGFGLVIFPGGLARAVLRQMQAYFASLHATRSNKAFADRMALFDELNGVIGLPELLEESATYEPGARPRAAE
ncbi:oxaloacetate decarboxylase [Oceanicella sp. SM1341]|uniref:isocitrate lyase/PEP mutase family protein n=1 Tax=Oceanicella sp. SM1341 TaxID=1548889 RepID=UPI000E5204BC|nr:isocitrate lyase/phosphoenolpyruvate mutase family protein [Oceanicella sp. SM1341]